ncbi:MAG: transposase [Saprospiraceae bacterium]|nr:transposase [Saprospiraceae bacterium]
MNYHLPIDDILHEVQKIRWVVHSTHPTMNTIVIEKYLARYINRVAISNNRLQYLKDNHKVIILYNDYKNQLSGCPAPKAFKELDPIPLFIRY